MRRTLPPTAAPIPIKDFMSSVLSLAAENDAQERLKDQLKSYFGPRPVFPVSSGKAALSIALSALQKITSRTEVVIPAYSSFCLASAVAQVGLSVKLCDIDPRTLDFDFDLLRKSINHNTLAVISVHSYGLVSNLEAVIGLCRQEGAWVVEDAAQAAGATCYGRKVGTIGDVGILSLGRGKNINALGGGVILTRHDSLARLVEEIIETIPTPSFKSRGSALFTGLCLAFFLNPRAYGIPAKFSFLGIGANVFDPGFRVTKLAPLNARLASRAFSYLDQYNEVRVRNASHLKDRLDYRLISRPEEKGEPVYLRFPIMFADQSLREELFSLLNGYGLGVNKSYPTPLNRIEKFRPYLVSDKEYPGAEEVSTRILTLPTHPYVKPQEIDKIASLINKVHVG